MIYLYKTNGVITVGEDGKVPVTYYGRGGKSGKFYPSGNDNILLVLGGDSYDTAWENLTIDGTQANSQFGALLLLEQFFAGLPLQLPLRLIWEDINQLAFPVNVVSNWNDFFNLPNQGNSFTSVEVVDNEVRLFGGSSINMQAVQFKNDAFTNAILISIIDECNCVISINEQSFAQQYKLEIVFLPAVIHVYGLETFIECISLKNINLKSCITFGDTIYNDSLFYSIMNKTFTLTIPSILMTCNSGNPDGDIQYLQANNNVTIITV